MWHIFLHVWCQGYLKECDSWALEEIPSTGGRVKVKKKKHKKTTILIKRLKRKSNQAIRPRCWKKRWHRKKKGEWNKVFSDCLEYCIFIRPSVQFRPDPATFPQWRPSAVVTLVRWMSFLATQKTHKPSHLMTVFVIVADSCCRCRHRNWNFQFSSLPFWNKVVWWQFLFGKRDLS